MRGEASTLIDAPPQVVWALVSDVTRMGEWSPECVRCEWVEGATSAVQGARFKGSNKRGFARWSTTCTVVTADAPEELAFKVGDPDKADAIVWRYTLRPEGEGTRLSESFDLPKEQAWYYRFINRAIGVKDRQADMTKGMETTLARIKAVAEGR